MQSFGGTAQDRGSIREKIYSTEKWRGKKKFKWQISYSEVLFERTANILHNSIFHIQKKYFLSPLTSQIEGTSTKMHHSILPMPSFNNQKVINMSEFCWEPTGKRTELYKYIIRADHLYESWVAFHQPWLILTLHSLMGLGFAKPLHQYPMHRSILHSNYRQHKRMKFRDHDLTMLIILMSI